MGRPYITFNYNDYGAGSLIFVNASENVVHNYDARSGSINTAGELVNCIEPGAWVMKDAPVDTAEVGMWIEPGMGWKARLFRPDGDGGLAYTHYCLHPDGGKGGTLGCIGIIGTDCHALRDVIAAAIAEWGTITVFVRGSE